MWRKGVTEREGGETEGGGGSLAKVVWEKVFLFNPCTQICSGCLRFGLAVVVFWEISTQDVSSSFCYHHPAITVEEQPPLREIQSSEPLCTTKSDLACMRSGLLAGRVATNGPVLSLLLYSKCCCLSVVCVLFHSNCKGSTINPAIDFNQT